MTIAGDTAASAFRTVTEPHTQQREIIQTEWLYIKRISGIHEGFDLLSRWRLEGQEP